MNAFCNNQPSCQINQCRLELFIRCNIANVTKNKTLFINLSIKKLDFVGFCCMLENKEDLNHFCTLFKTYICFSVQQSNTNSDGKIAENMVLTSNKSHVFLLIYLFFSIFVRRITLLEFKTDEL